MDKVMQNVVRQVSHAAEDEPVILLRLPGTRSCPLGGDQGIINCPLGFGEKRKPPSELQPWMRGRCENESWRQRWSQILAHCQQCQGKPQATPDELSSLLSVYEILSKEGNR